jgi:hypothetical protein
MKKNSTQLDNQKTRKQAHLPSRFSPNFLSKMDGRFLLAKELRVAYEEITADQGGPEGLSHVSRALCEKFVWLEAILRKTEAQIAASDDAEETGVLLSRWIQGLNSLCGLGRAIGIKRQAKRIPSLENYVRGKAAK